MRILQRSLYAIFLIEFLDEFIFGVREAAWPQIRDSLSLSYTEVGVILSVPPLVGNLIEPVLGLLGDTRHRRLIISLGGLILALATALCGLATSFWVFLLGALLFNPASGAFVSLSQASLMDADPEEREKNLARWTLAGSLGVASGPLFLGGAAWLGLSWRHLFLLAALMILGGLWFTRQHPLPAAQADEEAKEPPLVALRAALAAPAVLRYVFLLELADLLADVFFGFLALYLVDVLSLSASEAGLGVLLWTLSSLLGDALLLPVLARVESTRYLRMSALASLLLYALFLGVSSRWLAYALLVALGLARAGWYSILMARLYDELPGRSGVVLALNNLFNFVAALIPLGLGLLAERYGLGSALWLLALGPLSILLGVRAKRS